VCVGGCVCERVRACARACMRACVCVCVPKCGCRCVRFVCGVVAHVRTCADADACRRCVPQVQLFLRPTHLPQAPPHPTSFHNHKHSGNTLTRSTQAHKYMRRQKHTHMGNAHTCMGASCSPGSAPSSASSFTSAGITWHMFRVGQIRIFCCIYTICTANLTGNSVAWACHIRIWPALHMLRRVIASSHAGGGDVVHRGSGGGATPANDHPADHPAACMHADAG